MTKIRSILKSAKDADGRYPVLLCISDRGKRAYFSTGFSAIEKEFEMTKEGGRFVQGKGIKKFNLTRKEEDGSTKAYTNKEANDKLAALEERAQGIIRKYNEEHLSWGFEQLRADFTNAPKREYYYSFAKDAIEKEYRSRGQFGKATIAEAALKSLMDYDAQLEKRSFHDITVTYLNDYISHCRKKGQVDGTISIRLREIRRIFSIAIRDKVINPELYPFSSGKEDGKVKIPKTVLSKTDQYLPLESMRLIAKSKFDDPVLERAKHLFLFSYYCRGINWRDMALLTKDNLYQVTVTDTTTKKSNQVTMLQYKRAKTKGEFDIQVTPYIQQELDWFKDNTPLFQNYLLPIISVNKTPEELGGYIHQIRKRFNRSLKDIAKAVGLPESQQKISIYSARHSFAMTLQDKGASVDIISQALGHQSVETTKHYLAKFSTTKMAEETYIDLFEEPKKPKKARISRNRDTKKSRRP